MSLGPGAPYPALPVPSSGEVLAGTGNRHCQSFLDPRLNGVEPSTLPQGRRSRGPRQPAQKRESGNRRQREWDEGAGRLFLSPRFRAETPFPPTLSPASRHSPQPQESTSVVTKSLLQQPSPRPGTSTLPVRPDSGQPPTPARPLSLRMGWGVVGARNRGLRRPLVTATRPSPQARILCPQIRARAWSVVRARRAACWGAARTASACPTAWSSRGACRSVVRTAPPTVMSVSCAWRAAAATRTCVSCIWAAVAVRGGWAS